MGLFTAAVRRDIWSILLSPTSPESPPAPPPPHASPAGLEIGLALRKPAAASAPPGVTAACAFGVRSLPLPPLFELATDAELQTSIGMMGRTDHESLALLQAFEALLVKACAGWTAAQANALSVEFLVAFGNELGERLDIRQRVRSTKLMADELHTLRTPPFAALVDQGMLGMFQ